jgi:hypothetical protein
MKPFTGIARLFGHQRPKISQRLWLDLVHLARMYPDPQQFRQKAVIAAAIQGVTEEQLMSLEIIPRRMVTSEQIVRRAK